MTVVQLLQAEWLKFRSTRTPHVVIDVALVISLLQTVLITAIVESGDMGPPDELLVGLALTGSPIGLALLVLGVLGMAGEFRYGTITYTFLATPRRLRVILLKLGFYFVAGIVAAVAMLVLIQLTTVVVFGIRGMDVPWPQGDVWLFYLRVAVTTGLFAAFGVAVAALIRSQVLAVSIVLGWMVLEATILPFILILARLEDAVSWLPLRVFLQATGLLEELGGEVEPGVVALSANQALFVGLGYIAVIAVAAVLTTMRRDVT